MMGPNLSATAEMANAVSIPVIASGGVSSARLGSSSGLRRTTQWRYFRKSSVRS